MGTTKNLHKENDEVIEENLPFIRKPKRKKRYPGGKIFAPYLISQKLKDYVHQEYYKMAEKEASIEKAWEEFVEGLI